VPFTALSAAAEAAKGTSLRIGAQNMHEAKEGPFTGEISGAMLKEAGATFVLLGHSERRSHFGETDPKIHQKVLRALEVGLTPVLCVGETLAEREAGRTEEVLERQLKVALEGIRGDLMVAYEPVWAIGTGRSATPQMASEVHAFCRAHVGKKVPILYGGSVKEDNIAELISESEIDGVLVGNASLNSEKFSQMIKKVR
jgi:triosephosphate isomerase (TIM)